MSKDKTVQQNQQPLTPSDQIWLEIKDKNLDMFALTGKKVSDYCQPEPVDPSRCFLTFKAPAVLAALDDLIGKDYDCTMEGKYIIVSKKVKRAF